MVFKCDLLYNALILQEKLVFHSSFTASEYVPLFSIKLLFQGQVENDNLFR